MSGRQHWQSAQENELKVWEITSKSQWRVLSELSESCQLQCFIESKLGQLDTANKKILEVGIGPLGIGWAGLFGSQKKNGNIAVEPLPILAVNTGLRELDELIRKLQSRVEVVRAQGEQLEFSAEGFDIVVCNDVIDHALDYQAVLNECFRVLKKSGLFIFSVNVFSILGRLKWDKYTKRRHPCDTNVLCHIQSLTYYGIRRILDKAGFRITHSNSRDFPVPAILFGKSRKARFLCVK